ncbi:gamma-glutamylcyclotransferase [Aliidiomarina taiwanensis]|uniref:glutathione-specific gamma-glutamylcyclotransferase n=1 Tax=Aliidiomarina taiwanensis TaxID=946228 RepID=A0A432X8I0_9GAMM|nr:gamma-glutamylcyclotransferase [Aliidiomarina taiwanensis]RUO43630.1 gamma-glutamylcyclotransferase [Aliidiomarina taiwanensis]
MLDTQAMNQAQGQLVDGQPVWLFGYGSLIYKVDFDYIERRPARIDHWVRRFWQGSHDHRGTPTAPGRVATLIEQPGASCVGMAYKVSPDVFGHLDHREKNGYLRIQTPFHFSDGTEVEGLVYIAAEDNSAYLGPAPEAEIAAHIARSKGPSGPNDEYLLKLAEALRQLEAQDEHVFAIEQHLLAMQNN